MEDAKENAKPNNRVKKVLFTIFAALFSLGGLFFLESLFEGLLPWVTIGCPGCDPDPSYNIDLYRWFGAQHGATVGILFTGSLITLLWKPSDKPLLMQYYIIGFILFLAGFTLFDLSNVPILNMIIVFIFPLIILAATYPGKGLWNNMFKQADYHVLLLSLTFIALVLLAPVAWQHGTFQLKYEDDYANYFRWAESVNLSVALIVASLLASTRKPGWKQLTILIGIAYLYLGIAAFTVPDLPGSWGIGGGILSILGGIAYLGCAIYQRKPRNDS